MLESIFQLINRHVIPGGIYRKTKLESNETSKDMLEMEAMEAKNLQKRDTYREILRDELSKEQRDFGLFNVSEGVRLTGRYLYDFISLSLLFQPCNSI